MKASFPFYIVPLMLDLHPFPIDSKYPNFGPESIHRLYYSVSVFWPFSKVKFEIELKIE